jgi:hypothetical protein
VTLLRDAVHYDLTKQKPALLLGRQVRASPDNLPIVPQFCEWYDFESRSEHARRSALQQTQNYRLKLAKKYEPQTRINRFLTPKLHFIVITSIIHVFRHSTFSKRILS